MDQVQYQDLFSSSEASSSAVSTSVQDILNNSNSSSKYMNDQQRMNCIKDLLHNVKGVELPRGFQQKMAVKYTVSRWTIGRLWKAVKNHLLHSQALKPTKNYKGNVGRKRIAVGDEEIMALPLRKRCNIRSMANALNISKSALHRQVKWGKVRRHTSSLKPGLTDKNKVQRLRFCLQELQTPTTNNQVISFKDMYNGIHVDEKWFFMSKTSQNFYLAPTEMEPYRSTKHKSHILKVMFLVAVTRPWFGENGEVLFDGNIGYFPLTEVVPAQRNSIHRPRGTLETKPIKCVNQKVIRKVFITKLIPAIKLRWPIGGDGKIYIQQDNATPHILNDDIDFHRVANEDGFNISLVSQPPNSPDLNVLDLGFFRAIQSIQHQQMPTNIDELVNAVNYAYWSFEPKVLDKVFLSYQYVMREVMKVGGGNNFKLPHAAKDRLEREGTLPKVVQVLTEVINQAIHSLNEQEEACNSIPNHYISNEAISELQVHALQIDVGNLNINTSNTN